MKSRLVSVPQPPKTMSCRDLQIGQLGRMVGNDYNGIIITKIYGESFVAVYRPDGRTPFKTTFTQGASHQVELLGPDEKIELSND